jgi:hypothetical protein
LATEECLLLHIDLDALESCTPQLSPAFRAYAAEACVVALSSHRHASGVEMPTDLPTGPAHSCVEWTQPITQPALNTHRDARKRTDFAACAIALSLQPQISPYLATIVSETGDRIDFLLGSPDPLNFLDPEAFLEVSGIDSETDANTVSQRVRSKIQRLNRPGGPGSGNGNVYVTVVEFSRPRAVVVLT